MYNVFFYKINLCIFLSRKRIKPEFFLLLQIIFFDPFNDKLFFKSPKSNFSSIKKINQRCCCFCCDQSSLTLWNFFFFIFFNGCSKKWRFGQIWIDCQVLFLQQHFYFFRADFLWMVRIPLSRPFPSHTDWKCSCPLCY